MVIPGKGIPTKAIAVSIHDMTRRTLFLIAVLSLATLAFAQTEPKAPCDYDKELLRNRHGRIALFTSDEMKARATHKQDVAGIRQLDIKGTTIVDVLVAPDGHVVCTKSLIGHPIIRKSVEDALREWTFSPFKVHDRNVAYLGRLEFTLCNISCGEAGLSMTIVK